MKRPLLLTLLTAFAVLVFVAAVAPVFGAPLAAPGAQETKPIVAQPSEGAAVRDVVQIIGTATHPQFQRYELYYAPYPVPSDQSWIFIGDAHNNQQPLGLLGTWDSRSVADGDYALRVRVVKADGNYIDSDPHRVSVANSRPAEPPTPATPETPLPELPPTEAPSDATAVVEQPTASAPGQGVAVPTIAPTPTLGVTVAAGAGFGATTGTPTPKSTSAAIAGSGDSASIGDSATSIASQLFSGSRLMDTAKKAATYTVAAFVLVGLFFGVKGMLVWLWYKIKP